MYTHSILPCKSEDPRDTLTRPHRRGGIEPPRRGLRTVRQRHKVTMDAVGLPRERAEGHWEVAVAVAPEPGEKGEVTTCLLGCSTPGPVIKQTMGRWTIHVMYVQQHGESGLAGTLEGPTGLSGEVGSGRGRLCLCVSHPGIKAEKAPGRGQADGAMCHGSRLPAALSCQVLTSVPALQVTCAVVRFRRSNHACCQW